MGLRICQVVPYYDPHVGGVESHVQSVGEELVRRGHEVTVVTSLVEGSEREETRGGVRVLRAPQVVNLFNTPLTRGLGELVDAAEPEIVHSHSPPPLASFHAARWRARNPGVPHVLTYHCDLDIPVAGGDMVVGAYRRTLGRYTLERADRIVATTSTYARTSRSLWRRRDVDVVPNPVDVDRFHPGTEGKRVREELGVGDRAVAMFVGRLAPHKGVESFVRAAEFTGEDVVHLVVGDGPRREALGSLAAQVEGGWKVRFAGRVPHGELPAYYQAADLGVLPSTSRLEAFGIATLEAMASGKPVVVSDIPGVTEVIEEEVTGLLTDPLNPRDLAAKVDRLAGDPELRRRMGARGRERVLERFTTEAVVDRLEELYVDALA